MARSNGYRVEMRVQGRLDPGWWSSVFAGLTVAGGSGGATIRATTSPEPDDETTITGTVADQAALHGLLATVRDLGLSIVSLDAVPDVEP